VNQAVSQAPSLTIAPGLADLDSAFAQGRGVLVHTRVINDLETPVSALLKLGGASGGAFLLESVQGGDWRGRYSVIGLKPDLVWRVVGGQAQVSKGGFADADFSPLAEAPIAALRTLVAENALPFPEGFPPMAAGLFGYLGYDMIRYVERLPGGAPDPLNAPEALLLRPTVVAVFDSVAAEILLVTVARPGGVGGAQAALAAAHARLHAAVAALEGPAPPRRRGERPPAHPPLEPVSNTSPETYRANVERARAYAHAGDIFQVVPSQRFSAPLEASALALYRALRRLNPSPFLFFFDFEGFQIVGSSPEILVRLRDGVVTVRPIAGTRPRGATPAEDAALEAELLADPKERAEHLMLLDLGRNDVGRVARRGPSNTNAGVRVTQQFTVERYSHVMHIVSNVEGVLAPGHDAIDALFAGFPAGTVSGAPKVRAMEIIDELEPHRRTIYAGGVGYIGAGGEMDTCIALRTAVVKDGVMHVQAGGGVVMDSDPEAERMETVHKARALFRAAEEAWRFE
jgi:anthranilate synthase component I